MRRPGRRRRRRAVPIALALAASLGAGCGRAPPVPEDRFYRLPEVPAVPAAPATRLEGLVLVRPFESDGLHSERAILYAEDANALSLKRYHYYFWLNNPPRLLRDYMVEHIRAAKLAPMVVTDIGAAADFVVSGKIERFERHLLATGSEALVTLELRLDRGDGGGWPVLLRQYRAVVPVERDSMAAAVAAMGRGLDRTFAAFLRDARDALAVRSGKASSRAAR